MEKAWPDSLTELGHNRWAFEQSVRKHNITCGISAFQEIKGEIWTKSYLMLRAISLAGESQRNSSHLPLCSVAVYRCGSKNSLQTKTVTLYTLLNMVRLTLSDYRMVDLEGTLRII